MFPSINVQFKFSVLFIGWLYFIGHILSCIALAFGIFVSVKCLNNESEAEACQMLGEGKLLFRVIS